MSESFIVKKMDRFLNWSERILKTDVRYVARNGIWLTLGQLGSIASGMLLGIAFANLLEPTAYGNYKYVLSVASIVGAFSLTGLSLATTQAVARGHEGIVRSGFWLGLRWSLGIVVISIGGATYYFMQGNMFLAISFLLIGTFTPIIKSATIYGGYLSGKKQFSTQVIFGFFQTAVPSLIIISFLFFSKNPLTYVFIYFSGTAVTALFFYYLTLRIYKPTHAIDLTTINYSKHLSIQNILGVIQKNLDKILVFHYLGAVNLAIYTFASQIPEQLRSPLDNIGLLALPKFSLQTSEQIRHNLFRKSVLLFLLTLPLVVVYIALAPFLFKIVFPKYMSSVIYSQIYVLNLLVPGQLYGTYIDAQRKIKEKYIVRILSPLFEIALMVWLTISYGLMGMVISQVAIRVIDIILIFFVLKKYE